MEEISLKFEMSIIYGTKIMQFEFYILKSYINEV